MRINSSKMHDLLSSFGPLVITKANLGSSFTLGATQMANKRFIGIRHRLTCRSFAWPNPHLWRRLVCTKMPEEFRLPTIFPAPLLVVVSLRCISHLGHATPHGHDHCPDLLKHWHLLHLALLRVLEIPVLVRRVLIE